MDEGKNSMSGIKKERKKWPWMKKESTYVKRKK